MLCPMTKHIVHLSGVAKSTIFVKNKPMAEHKTITMCKLFIKKKAKHKFLPLHVRLYDAICALTSVIKGQRPA